MSRSKRELSGEEQRLWARVARTVRTKKPQPAAPAEEPPPLKRAKSTISAEPTKAAAKQRAKPKPAPVADRGTERKVKRGQLEIAARLDLHGHTQDSGRDALIRFISSAPAPSTVLVITGKGRMGEEGVLRRRLKDWLDAPAIRPLISGVAQAHASHGGSGAFYIFVRRH